MAKLTPSQLDRSRPSSRLQAQTMLETTPVLFRLPSVQLQPLPPVADFPSESLAEFQNELPAAEVAANPPVPQAITTAAKSQTDEDEAAPSWWEHWSSGVILILLLVAAYFACIAVLRSRGRGSNTLAKDSAELADPNALKIPPIVSDLPSNTGATASNNSAADDLVNSLTLEPSNSIKQPAASTPMATAELLEPKQMPELPLLDSFQPNSSGVNATPASNQLGPNQLGQSPTLYDGANNTHSSQQLATSLAEPSLPEFTPQPLSGGLSMPALAGSSNMSGSPASSSFTLNGPSGAPNLLAGNNSISNPPALSGTPDLNAINTPSLTPGSSAVGGSGIPNLVPNTQPQQPAASMVSTGSSANPSAGVPTPSNIRTTGTPEGADQVESIIRAYIELSRAGQIQSSSNANSNNRYQPAR